MTSVKFLGILDPLPLTANSHNLSYCLLSSNTIRLLLGQPPLPPSVQTSFMNGRFPTCDLAPPPPATPSVLMFLEDPYCAAVGGTTNSISLDLRQRKDLNLRTQLELFLHGNCSCM